MRFTQSNKIFYYINETELSVSVRKSQDHFRSEMHWNNTLTVCILPILP